MKNIPTETLSAPSLNEPLSAIVAMGRGNEIGFEGDMPWHIPEDLRHFKQLTLGHPVIMGRATWMSLPRRPLPGRLNIVLTRDPEAFLQSENSGSDNLRAVSSIGEAVSLCPHGSEPFIIGGGKVYALAMPLLSRIEVTRIDADFPDADTFFPAIDPAVWSLTRVSEPMLSSSGLTFRFETYERRNNQ